MALWRDGQLQVIITQETLEELANKLPQKASQFGAEPSLAGDWLDHIETYADKVVASGEVIAVCRDPTDGKFLDAAVSGHAAVLVTCDKDLLEIEAYRSVRILSPRDFWEMLA